MNSSASRKYLCEFIGTFALVFFAAGAVMVSVVNSNIGALGSGLISGGIITVVIFSFGHISGAHVNPALSLTAAFLGELEWRLLPGYIVAQLGGSICAGFALLWLIGPVASVGANIPNEVVGVTPAIAFVIELFLSFLLMWVICGTAYHHRAQLELAAIPVGVTVGIEVMLMGPYAGAAMNPARALGPYLAHGDLTHLWIYTLGPILGMLAGGFVYRYTHADTA